MKDDDMKKKNKNDMQRHWVRCAKTGKLYLPVDSLDQYSERGESVFTELGMIGLLRRKKFEGNKIRMPSKLFSSQKFGRIIWLAYEDDFNGDSHGGVREARPAFCLTTEGARELMRLHSLRYGSKGIDVPDTDMCDIVDGDSGEKEEIENKNAAKPQKGDKI